MDKDRVSVSEMPQIINFHDEPTIIEMPKVRMPAEGPMKNGLEGLIIHFNAGRWNENPKKGVSFDDNAMRTIEGGIRNGYYFSAMSRTGNIFIAKGQRFDHWGSHAGQSLCPATGRTGVSRYYHGVEISNPGIMSLDRKNGVIIPWYNRKFYVNSSGEKVYEKVNGHYVLGSPNDEYFNTNDPRIVHVEKTKENIQPGYYLQYSDEQKIALIRLVMKFKREHKNFKIEQVFGHDSVAPKRKNDPGGCLGLPGQIKAVTVMEFQKFLADVWKNK